MWNRCSPWLVVAALGCRPEPPPKDSPYKVAAESFALQYCERAFSRGCNVPDDCGIPGGFIDQSDCEFRLVPFMRSCWVPDNEADAIIETLNACEDVLAEATCDESLCDGGPLDTDPCLGLFDDLSGYCTFEGL